MSEIQRKNILNISSKKMKYKYLWKKKQLYVFVEIQDFGKVFSLRYKENGLSSIINESIIYQIRMLLQKWFEHIVKIAEYFESVDVSY